MQKMLNTVLICFACRRSFGPSSAYSVKKEVTANQFARRASFSKVAGTVLTSSRLPDEEEQAKYKKERRRESFLEAAKTVGLGKMRNEHFYKPKKEEAEGAAEKPRYTLRR